jgi:hypothetical protein
MSHTFAGPSIRALGSCLLFSLFSHPPLLAQTQTPATIEQAILRHAQEADLARLGFERLSDIDQAALLAFLKTL